MDPQLTKNISSLILKYFHAKPNSIKLIGGGFYGRVYLIEIDISPYKIVVKVYSKEGLNRREQLQLITLARYSLIPMPQVYFLHDSDEEIPMDVLTMEYVDGINAGKASDISIKNREKIGDQIVDNLIAYHNIINPNGFGELNSPSYEKDWKSHYREKAYIILKKAEKMHDCKKLDDEVYQAVSLAYEDYENIFGENIIQARLIHGDYNTWNILLNKECSAAIAVIDPFNCCFADSELDLYQLNNANGKYFGLMKNYQSKVPMSRNFEIKLCFYEVFTEIMHFYDANVDISKSNIKEQANQLRLKIGKIS